MFKRWRMRKLFPLRDPSGAPALFEWLWTKTNYRWPRCRSHAGAKKIPAGFEHFKGYRCDQPKFHRGMHQAGEKLGPTTKIFLW